ncbi:MAG: hypothetical protein IRY99_26750 [Isosphaeraceae bacterium]|nr:hypothetical protein [Isosphaeraceae bacterium]
MVPRIATPRGQIILGIGIALSLLGATPTRARFGGVAPEESKQQQFEQRHRRALLEVRLLEAQIRLKKAEIERDEAEYRLQQLQEQWKEELGPQPESKESQPSRSQKPQAGLIGAKPEAARAALDRSIEMPFPDETPLGEVLKYLRAATRSSDLPNGIPIFVDPEGLKRAGVSLESKVQLKAEGIPLREALAKILQPLKLDYTVEEGLLKIGSAAAEKEAEIDPKTRMILDQLERPISMPFPNETPLSDVLKYIKTATASSELPEGIPIYVDPIGLAEAEKTEDSPVKMNLEGVRLKRCLRLILRQLGLTYDVRDGLLMISTRKGLEQDAQSPPPDDRPKPRPIR